MSLFEIDPAWVPSLDDPAIFGAMLLRRIHLPQFEHRGIYAARVLKCVQCGEPLVQLQTSHVTSPASSFAIAQTRHLEGQLDLPVVVALVPNHMLKERNRVVVVKVHALTRFHPAVDRVALFGPLFFGEFSCKLGGVFGNEHQPQVMHERQQAERPKAVRHHRSLQPAVWEGAEQIDRNEVVPVPGVKKSLKQALIVGCRHNHIYNQRRTDLR